MLPFRQQPINRSNLILFAQALFKAIKESGDLFECSLSIVSCGGDVLEAGEERAAAGVRGPNMAKQGKLLP